MLGASPPLRAGDRAIRGSGFASGPGAARRVCSAPLLSLALLKIRIHADFEPGVFAKQKPQGMVTADILSGIPAVFRLSELLRSSQQLQ
jgi:hypothetical protein